MNQSAKIKKLFMVVLYAYYQHFFADNTPFNKYDFLVVVHLESEAGITSNPVDPDIRQLYLY